MLAAQAQVKAYQAAMNEFLGVHRLASSKRRAKQAPEEFKSLMVSRHNTAVTEMEGVAAAFNDQIKAYRAANPARRQLTVLRIIRDRGALEAPRSSRHRDP